MMQSLFRVFAYATQNFFRNFWLTVATLIVMVILLFLINITVSIDQIKTALLTEVDQRIDISLFFKQNVPQAEVLAIKEELERNENVAKIVVISPDEGLTTVQQRYPKIAEKILPTLQANPLGFTLRIKAATIENYTTLLADIEKNESIAEKLDSANFVDSRIFTAQAASLSEKINIATLALAIIFVLIASVIIFNTIRVSVYTHRDEISIMKLVGATNWFVRAPFLIESVFYSLLSMGIMIGLLFFLLNFIQPYMTRFFAGFISVNLIEYYRSNFWTIFGLETLLIVTLNSVSTTFAMRRYLKT